MDVKTVFGVDPLNTQEDVTLSLYCTFASDWIEELLGRKFSYATRTEWYKGTGTQRLLLRYRPVYPAGIQAVVDENGNFGQASGSFGGASPSAIALSYGQDFALQIDDTDGAGNNISRSGILWRIGDYWNKPIVRQAGLLSPFVWDDPGSIQVTYSAGFTLDTLPSPLRLAALGLVGRIRHWMTQGGLPLAGEAYEERSISLALGQGKDYLVSEIKPLLNNYRNWRW